MKTYVMTTGILFGLLAVAHLARMVMESPPWPDGGSPHYPDCRSALRLGLSSDSGAAVVMRDAGGRHVG